MRQLLGMIFARVDVKTPIVTRYDSRGRLEFVDRQPVGIERLSYRLFGSRVGVDTRQ